MNKGQFIENMDATTPSESRAVVIEQRRNGRETLVRFQNGRMRWVRSDSLKGPNDDE
jgi:hypothetical protein